MWIYFASAELYCLCIVNSFGHSLNQTYKIDYNSLVASARKAKVNSNYLINYTK